MLLKECAFICEVDNFANSSALQNGILSELSKQNLNSHNAEFEISAKGLVVS